MKFKARDRVQCARSLRQFSSMRLANLTFTSFTAKFILGDHCHQRPPVLKDHGYQKTGCCYWQVKDRNSRIIQSFTRHILRDHIFLWPRCLGVVFQIQVCYVNKFLINLQCIQYCSLEFELTLSENNTYHTFSNLLGNTEGGGGREGIIDYGWGG